MIRRIDLRGAQPTDGGAPDYRSAVPRADFDVEAAIPAVQAICEAVRTRGLEAILEFSERFDGVTQDDIRVPAAALTEALENLDPDIRAGLDESLRRLRATCEAELEHDVTTELAAGATVTHRKVPVDRVGLYVPGGLAPLVSSVLMNVVPAQVAGVRSIALTSTPQKDHGGLPHPTILAACALLGIDEVYAVGGAQAIAMFAYGVGPCRKVDLVTGPGSIYTVTAKRLLKGLVGIDSEAGPTEIAILADDTAEAAFVAADLVSQAEHDPLAAAVLVTPSEQLAAAVEAELDTQVAATKHSERIMVALGGRPVGDRDRRRPRAGPRGGQRVRRGAPGDPDRRRRGVRRPGAQRRCDLRRPARPGLARRLLRRLQPRAAHGRLRLPLLGPVSARVHQVGPRRRLLPRGAGRGCRPCHHPGRGRGPARPRGGRQGAVLAPSANNSAGTPGR